MQPDSLASPARCLPVRLPVGILIRARARIKANGAHWLLVSLQCFISFQQHKKWIRLKLNEACCGTLFSFQPGRESAHFVCSLKIHLSLEMYENLGPLSRKLRAINLRLFSACVHACDTLVFHLECIKICIPQRAKRMRLFVAFSTLFTPGRKRNEQVKRNS